MQAAEKAIANPLLDEISLKGAKGVLINITAGPDLTLFELDEAANRIRAEVDPEANIMVGSTLDPEMAGMMRVSVVATGIDAVAKLRGDAAAAAGRRARRRRRRDRRHRGRRGAPPQPEPVAEAAAASRAPSFADHRVAVEDERAELFAEPEVGGAAARRRCSAPRPSASRSSRAASAVPGEPSPEALRRLQAAVQSVPKAAADGAPGRRASRASAEPGMRPADDQQPDPQDDRPGRPRAERAPRRARPSAARARQQPAPVSRAGLRR